MNKHCLFLALQMGSVITFSTGHFWTVLLNCNGMLRKFLYYMDFTQSRINLNNKINSLIKLKILFHVRIIIYTIKHLL